MVSIALLILTLIGLSVYADIDTEKPAVSNLKPANGSTFNFSDVIEIAVNVTDNVSVDTVLANISQPNSSSTLLELTQAGGTEIYNTTYTVPTQSGNYNITIIANDTSNNTNTNQTTLFSVIDFDFTLASTDIKFSDESPVEDATITINVTIANDGNENATDVVIQFLDDGVEIDNATINISGLSTGVANVTWTAQIGPSNITVIADADNAFAESNESNNNATKNISIDAYHIFYGFTTGIFSIGTQLDRLYDFDANVTNILIVDSDSLVNFGALEAIGRKNDSTVATGDFDDIDSLLNMSGFLDSIRAVWSTDGTTPKQTETFSTQGLTIANVPVANSTNTTAFRTGILWDTSDTSGDDEFDTTDQEDLVFITKNNASQGGKFGIYDYEVRVPALLRGYKGGGSSVDLFVEIS